MPLVAVSYSGNVKITIDIYNKLPETERVGEYWNNVSDSQLQEAKKYIKNHYIKQQDYTCCYCKQRNEVSHNAVWDTEHIIPKSKYPNFLFEPKNLCISCKDCNLAKSNKNVLNNINITLFPSKSENYIIVHPHLDEYDNHIKVLESSQFYIPMDCKGRKTIEICGLLRFLYKFSGYGNIALELKKKLGSLNKELLATNDPLVENIILSAISDLAEQGRKISKKKALSSILS